MADITVHVTLPNKKVINVTVPGDDIVFAVMDKVKVHVVKCFCLYTNIKISQIKHSQQNNRANAFQNCRHIIYILCEIFV